MIRSTHIAGLLVLGALAGFSSRAAAAECKASIDSTDAMQFTTKALTVPKSCKTFTVTLKHVGKLPATVMGHNLVLGKTADIAGIAADGMKAGAASQYVKPGDARVIASSKVIGGGQSTTVTIPVAKLKAGESYTYACTFPGHSSIMRGTLTLK
ncbi:azurin [Cognatilysobacter tabacisoli]|uniref:azurin n=1 Tax=Cognatilysobacter tabacisoli TaxID=2315424 RepID=UPI000E6B3423|nr:azurin [Lysobacter tabacisoli]